jgi:hypothetical protein
LIDRRVGIAREREPRGVGDFFKIKKWCSFVALQKRTDKQTNKQNFLSLVFLVYPN